MNPNANYLDVCDERVDILGEVGARQLDQLLKTRRQVTTLLLIQRQVL
jgi:hypothetical protein